MLRTLNSTYVQIRRQIAAVERAVLAFQPVVVKGGGPRAAEDSNSAIILTSRLSNVWQRLGVAIPPGRP